MPQNSDHLFANPSYRPHAPFVFDQAVSDVFDDMISRSVPFYHEMQQLICDLTQQFIQPDTHVLDFGCSTGTTLISLSKAICPSHLISFRGFDNSLPMLEKARNRAQNAEQVIDFQFQDLNQSFEIPVCSVAIFNLVLQFLQPSRRGSLVEDLYKSLMPGGLVIVIEKVSPEDESLLHLWTTLYHQFKKRQGYTDIEILRKQAALTKVLIPWKASETMALFKDSGFSKIESIFQWQHFMGFMALK